MVLSEIFTLIISIFSLGVAGFSVYYSKSMQKVDLTHQNYEDIKKWYEETLHVMIELSVEYAQNYTNEKYGDLQKALVNFSQLIDTGRLYFPNIQDGTKTKWNAPKENQTNL